MLLHKESADFALLSPARFSEFKGENYRCRFFQENFPTRRKFCVNSPLPRPIHVTISW